MSKVFDYDLYDLIIINISGGKDSTCCIEDVLSSGINKNKIELWHQRVDGVGENFFDWPSTDGYVKLLAKKYGLKLAWQWRDKGFLGELKKENSRSHGVFSARNHRIDFYPTTKAASVATRKKWPNASGDLFTRWCTPNLKIDVSRRSVSNLFPGDKINPKKILFVTGERREESPRRAKLKNFEPHACNSNGRHVDHYRPVLEWSEKQIWEKLEENKILPHPAYFLGFPRLSCMCCIFLSKNHWSTLAKIYPRALDRIAELETEFNHTLDRTAGIWEVAALGESLYDDSLAKYALLALDEYTEQVTTDDWTLPKGAFGTGGG